MISSLVPEENLGIGLEECCRSGLSPTEAQRCERFNDAANQIRQLMERWDKRLTFEGLDIAKRYVDSGAEILPDFNVICGRQLQQFRAIFRATKPDILKQHSNMLALSDSHVLNFDNLGNGNKQFVFVMNIEIMQTPESWVSVPSLVCFQRPNKVKSLWGNFIYQSLFEY